MFNTYNGNNQYIHNRQTSEPTVPLHHRVAHLLSELELRTLLLHLHRLLPDGHLPLLVQRFELVRGPVMHHVDLSSRVRGLPNDPDIDKDTLASWSLGVAPVRALNLLTNSASTHLRDASRKSQVASSGPEMTTLF